MADKKDRFCSFCNKSFSTKRSLDFHQQTTKSCLEKQGKINTSNKCEYCNKILSTSSRLSTHLNVCMLKNRENNIENTIEKYKEYISKIEKENEEYKLILKEKDKYISKIEEMYQKANETISEIAKQPKSINNTKNNKRIKANINNFDINDIQRITNVLETHLTTEVLCKGQKGVAEMLKEHLLQNEDGKLLYECTDVSRQKFEFINKDGIIEIDSKANKLISSLNKANIYDKVHNTGQKLWKRDDGNLDYEAQHVHMPKVTEVLEISQDSSKLRSHLADITSR
jgi:hypothetical protein